MNKRKETAMDTYEKNGDGYNHEHVVMDSNALEDMYCYTEIWLV